MPFRPFLMAIGLMLCASSVAAQSARERLDAFTRGLQSLQGRFEQRVFDANGQMNEQSQGQVALQAPRQFRWDYEAPFPQTIVADGDQIWIYDPDLEQVTVRKQSYEEQSSPLAVLIDPSEMDRQFDVADMGNAQGLDWVKLTPKSKDAAFAEARLGFADGHLQRMVMQDNLGQRTEIRFSDWKRNPQLAAERFRFVPPPGVDVVGEVVQQAEVTPLRD